MILASSAAFAQHPFKYDSLYKRLYASQLCEFAKQHPDLQLIDVRSPGEYSDTSQYGYLNLGHLKGAVNLSIDTITKNIHVLDPYKEKTIVFYCSHSQRSRRVSKLASERGFTNFYSINGGMSSLNQLEGSAFPCKEDWIVSGLPYKNLFFDDAARLLKKNKNLFIIDLRPAAEFESKDSVESKNIGRIKNAKNISFEEISNKKISIPKDKTIVIYSSGRDDKAPKAAAMLKQSGYANVYLLAGGIEDLAASQQDLSFMENTPAYKTVDAEHAFQLLQANKNITVYDVRPDDEYENKAKPTYKNLGHVKGAIHANDETIKTTASPADKKAPILLYGTESAFYAAKELVKEGYDKVYVMGGLYDLVWSAFNVEANKEAKEFLTDHDGLY